ncbi:MAG: hypothetical protein D6806_01620, partial [Deltaproteobacteria bacterium]
PVAEIIARDRQVSGEPTAAPALPVGEISRLLRAARSVEEVAGVLVEMVANLVPRVLLLWGRAGWLYGFASRGMNLEEVKLLTLEIPARFVRELCGSELGIDGYVGPPGEGELVRRFYEILGGSPSEIVVVAAYVTADDLWLLYADAGTGPLPPCERRLLDVLLSRSAARADFLMQQTGGEAPPT